MGVPADAISVPDTVNDVGSATAASGDDERGTSVAATPWNPSTPPGDVVGATPRVTTSGTRSGSTTGPSPVPVTTEPVTTEPGTTKPVITKPVTTEPVTTDRSH